MAEIKWIKITTDIFDDEKILLIESLPEADSLIVIWFKLLSFAGKSNNNGVFMLSNRIPYTDEMLATIFRRPLNTVRMALQTFSDFGMIEYIDGVLTIPKWEKHQNVDGMDKIREQNRLRVARHREKQKLLSVGLTCQYCGGEATGDDHIIPLARGGSDNDDNKVPCCIECNRIKNDKPLVDFLNFNRKRIDDALVLNNPKLKKHVTLCNVTGCYIVTDGNAIEEDKEEDKDKDKEKRIDYQLIADLYNETCVSFPRLRALSDSRKKAIKARFNSGYALEDFKAVFEAAENSSFLKGKNDRNWSATFDWMIKDGNMAKILDGNYADKITQKKADVIDYGSPEDFYK